VIQQRRQDRAIAFGFERVADGREASPGPHIGLRICERESN
jgi:hypothetical protein